MFIILGSAPCLLTIFIHWLTGDAIFSLVNNIRYNYGTYPPKIIRKQIFISLTLQITLIFGIIEGMYLWILKFKF